MQWADITRPPTEKLLRQFAALSLAVFGGMAAWRWGHGVKDAWTVAAAIAAVGIGGVGLAWPRAIRPVFTGWMIAAFPIGWTVSRVMLAALFFGLFTPVALVFRLMGRDALSRRRGRGATYWVARPPQGDSRDYLRQF